MKQRARLLLVEDHEMVAQGLRSMLDGTYDVVALVQDGAHVVTAVAQFQPDLVLMDLSLPKRTGLDLLSDLRPGETGLKVLVVTMHVDHVLMDEAFRRGAAGYIPKNARAEELCNAIRDVLAGRRYVSPRIPKRGSRAASAPRLGFQQLTPRQQEVVRLLGHGLTTEQMADVLHISRWTVHFHRKSIRRELGLHSDQEMYHYAMLVVHCEEDEPVTPAL